MSDPPPQFSFLFLGNSYTSTNALPGLLNQLLKSLGSRMSKLEEHCPPGKNFASHIQDSKGEGKRGPDHLLHQWMEAGEDPSSKQHKKWDFCILQNQSLESGLHASPTGKGNYDAGHAAISEFCGKIHKYYPESQIIFYMTWGRRSGDNQFPEDFPDYLTMQSKITAGYNKYADDIGTPEQPAFVAPVGRVFETIYNDIQKETGEAPDAEGTIFHDLYVRDASHPTLSGSYVACMTIYATLLVVRGGAKAVGLPSVEELEWVPKDLDANVAAKLRDAVVRTMKVAVEENSLRHPPKDGAREEL
mgnify:CR=1 FL=1